MHKALVIFFLCAASLGANISDAQWEKFEKTILVNKRTSIDGWCNQDQALTIARFMKKHLPSTCIEIGPFYGATSYNILKCMALLKHGHLYAIDAWNGELAAKGLERDDPNYQWWQNCDMHKAYASFLTMLKINRLSKYCTVVRKDSALAHRDFKDGSIDFIFIDGNFSKSGSYEDVKNYYPKVAPGGFIMLNNANFPSKIRAVAFLMNNCNWVREFSIENSMILFQKKPL